MSAPVNKATPTISIRLSKSNSKAIVRGLKAEMKKRKASKNKCIESILLEYLAGESKKRYLMP